MSKQQTESYQSLEGSLMYLATCTRPDIAYAVGTLARFSSKPNHTHWVAAKVCCGTSRALPISYQEVCDHLPQFTPFYCHSHFHSIGKLVCKHTFSFCNFLFSYIINYCTLDTYSIGLKDQFDIIFVMVHWKLSLPIC